MSGRYFVGWYGRFRKVFRYSTVLALKGQMRIKQKSQDQGKKKDVKA